MRHIEISNLPLGQVVLALVDGRIDIYMEEKLTSYGIKLIKTKRHFGVYTAISYHPDIMLNHIGGDCIVYAPGTNKDLLAELKTFGYRIVEGESILKDKYPGNIAYNAARVGNFVFHNKKYIDPVLKNEFSKRDVELLHINQGYAKCSITILNEKLIMTADAGIAKVAEKNGIETLLIEQDENILLSDLSHGFIGGSSGLIDNNTLAITGNFDLLKKSNEIRQFLFKKAIQPISLSDKRIVDIGSILPIAIK